ncbi:hypothetical protein ACQ4PT_069830 [Festuca glaucescens]
MGKMPLMAAAAAAAALLAAVVALTAAEASLVEHTFVVRQMHMQHLCKDTLVTLVNGQFPGPAIEATEGDTVVVHVVNQSPYGITIHWHGVKQRLNCWADGAGMVTQCPIQPNATFSYRFNLTGQEGTLWWHSHVSSLRATLYGVIIIRPKSGAYPFRKPDMDVPIIIGEWWHKDLTEVDKAYLNSNDNDPAAATINGKLGDLSNCSGKAEDSYVLEVEPGKTYLLRLVNAALYSEYYFKVAGHSFTVVASDANYLTPFSTDVVAVAPGETMDVLMVADAPPCRTYHMVALAIEAPEPDPQLPLYIARGLVRYKNIECDGGDQGAVMPEMPDHHDTTTTFYFHGNLTGAAPGHPLLPQVRGHVDERLYIALGQGSVCRGNRTSCKRGGSSESMLVAYMNNASFHLPDKVALLEARYRGDASLSTVEELPSRPPRAFNYTDPALIPVAPGGKEEAIEPTRKATTERRFRYNATVEVVFQSTAMMQSDSNPMHLHGHDFFVLAQGHGNYDAARDARSYNLVDPPVKNTVHVPRLGWAAIRFVADNPGSWFLHCHFEYHIAPGMATVVVVENGPTPETTLPPPPTDLTKCSKLQQ